MSELKRVLGMPSVLFITINSIVGSGLFFLPAIGAAYSGPSSIIAWVVIATISVYMAMCFGELVSMFPSAGGIYEFTKQAFGRFTSFIIGWIAWLVGNVTTAMLIVGAIQYLLPVTGPEAMFVKLFISIFWVIAFNTMAYRGMKTSSFLLVSFSLITLFLITILIFAAIFQIDGANYTPFFIHQSAWSNVSYLFLTIFFVSQTFFGLESVTFLSEETKDPQRVLPKALILATIIIALLAILLVGFSLGAVNYALFSSAEAPFALLARMSFGSLGADLVTLGTYLVIMGAAAGWVVTSPRLVLALTRDRLFIPKFNAIHKEFRTPHRAIVFQAIMTVIFVLLAFFGSGYKTLLSMLIPMVLVMMSFAILAVTVLRFKMPHLKRAFKAPFGVVGPPIIVFFQISLVIVWLLLEQTATSLLFLIVSLIFFALPIYFLLELYYKPKTIEKTNNALAYISYWLENLTVPKKVRRKIFGYLGGLEGKRVLDFGCSVGTLTVPLVKAVGDNGFVYAVESSRRDIIITHKRLGERGVINFKVFRDEEEYSRIHPGIVKLDAVVSVGLISYVQNLQNILKELNARLPKGGRMVFVDYDKLFDVIPNIDWIEDDLLIYQYFENAGFKVKIERIRGLAWGYVYLYAKKVRNL